MTIEVNPADPVAYVWSLNIHRRQLTPSQKAMAGARARSIYDRQADERRRATQNNDAGRAVPANLPGQVHADARDAIGKAVGVGGRSIDYATKVLTRAEPEIIRAVDEGRMAVSTAAVLAHEPPEEQRRVAAEPKRNRM